MAMRTKVRVIRSGRGYRYLVMDRQRPLAVSRAQYRSVSDARGAGKCKARELGIVLSDVSGESAGRCTVEGGL